MLVSQRLANSFESHRGSSAVPPEFRVTVMPGQAGKRMIFDGFELILEPCARGERAHVNTEPRARRRSS